MSLTPSQKDLIAQRGSEIADGISSMPEQEVLALCAGCHPSIGTYTEDLGGGKKGSTYYLPDTFVTEAGLAGELIREKCDKKLLS